MIKTKKLKAILLMGVIACFVAIFCCIQAAFANNDSSDKLPLDVSANMSEITDSNGDVVIGKVEDQEFTDYKSFLRLCYETYGSRQSLTIHIQNNFNFQKNCCHVNNGRTFNFIIDENKWLFSTDAFTMFNVENGTLNLNSASGYAYVSEPGEDTAIVVYENGQVQADHIWFREPYEGKDAPSEGGVFYFDDMSKQQVFNNCIFDHNKAEDGGAIYVNSSIPNGNKFVFNNCEFDGCGAKTDGGAINNYAENVNMEFNHTTFKNCTSGSDGGAIAAKDHNQNYNFSNNTVFENCYASGDGGAIYVYGSNVKFVGGYKGLKPCDYTTFNNCISGDDGGAIYTSGAPGKGNDTSYEFFNFFSNEAKTGYGGAIGNHGANTIVKNSLFKHNKSDGAGGAIHSLPTDGICLESCVFENNTSDEGCNVLCSSSDDFRRSKNNTIYSHGPFSALDAFGQYWEDEDLVGRFRIIINPYD